MRLGDAAALADHCNVDLAWLATGEGHDTLARAAHGGASSPLDEELIELVIRQTVAYLQRKRYKAGPEETARLIIALYNLAKEEREKGGTTVLIERYGPIIDFGQKSAP